MGEIRGEKISFRKQDIVPLHRFPSAQVEDPVIVHCPKQRSLFGRLAVALVGLTVALCVAATALVLSVENGLFDTPLNERARAALNEAIGPGLRAEVGSTVIRFTSGFHLALEARNVDAVDVESGKTFSRAGAIRLALDPFQLIRGNIVISDIEAQKIDLNAALLGSGTEPLDLAQLRVDAIPAALEGAFGQLDLFKQVAERVHTDHIRIGALSINLPVSGDAPLAIEFDDLIFTRNADDGTLHLEGDVTIDGQVSKLSVTANSNGDKASNLRAELTDFALTPFLLKRDDEGLPRHGVDAVADFTVSARRMGEAADPAILIGARIDSGRFFAEGIEQDVRQTSIEAAYDFSKNSLEIQPSKAAFGDTRTPFTGAVIDLDRLDPAAGAGFGIDFVVSGGVAAPAGTGERPLAFDAKVMGRYVVATNELTFSELAVSTPLGAMFGSMQVRFGDSAPEISFGSQVQTLQTTAVRQLWPFWIAPKARRWALANVYGGTITSGSIGVFIPEGRLGNGPLRLGEGELNIRFDIEDTRVNLTGDIPPLRDASASVELNGSRLAVKFDEATSFFSSDRSVKVEGGEFVIPSTYDKPLMADMKLSLSGAADAVAELVTFKPIAVLGRTGFEPKDFSGKVRAEVKAAFGLVTDQDPPPPVWQASLDLANVDVAREIGGHRIAGLDGTLAVDPKEAVLSAKGRVDDVPLDISIIEPVAADAGVQRKRVVSGTLSNEDRNRMFPGLRGVVDGPVKIEATQVDDKTQAITADLSRAKVSVPWIGWTKGSGIAAQARFKAVNEANATVIREFDVDGEGFGVEGSLRVNKNGLVSADFSRVKLSASDDFALSVKRTRGGYDVSMRGSSVDARPVIARISRQASGGGGGEDAGGSATIRATIDKIIGFNGEALNNANLVYSTSGTKIRALEFSGTTNSGQAVVSQMAKAQGGANFIQVTSSDAGALSRFMDLYRHMRGGLLNVKLRARDDQVWNGNVDVRNFRLVDEERLQSIVSTPVGQDGRSLNSAVKRDIDVSSAYFQRGFARLIARNGTLRVENGVLRGEQVGATFQGVVRDANGQMDMTGTFMPAYGLNRLFAELPIIGVILGNGRDRGLLGITFKLNGQFEQPRLTINPLSLIAPGVFRQIFEFQ